MEQIIVQVSQNRLLVTLLTIAIILLFVWLVFVIVEKFFSDEISWLLQNTIFYSLNVFKITVTIFLLSFIWGFIYTIDANLLYGIIPSLFLAYLLYRIFVMRNKQSDFIKREFQLQKYSTKLSYIKDRDFNSDYRKKVYSAIINRIEIIDLENKQVENDFLLAFSKIYTFDNFNKDIENGESQYTVKHLFYEKYKLSLLSIIDDVRKIENNEATLKKVLANYQLLDFDGTKGLHYNSEKVTESVHNLLFDDSTELVKKYKSALEIKIDIKTAILFFNRYVELEFSNNSNLKQRFTQMVYFCKGEIDALPQFEDTNLIKTEDLKRIIAMYYQFNNRKENTYKIFKYKLPEMIDLVLYFLNKIDEKENQSLPKAHSSKEWELNNKTRTELNSILEKNTKID